MYPHRVRFSPVTSVPYFDERCGVRFERLEQFSDAFGPFWEKVQTGSFRPREYVVENFDLARQARRYLELCQTARASADRS